MTAFDARRLLIARSCCIALTLTSIGVACGTRTDEAPATDSGAPGAARDMNADRDSDLEETPDMAPDASSPGADLGEDMAHRGDMSPYNPQTRALLNTTPEACGACHVTHLEDWSGSMHAYATKDPIFEAMLKKGIEETQGKLDQFCIQCHAPVASKLGDTPVLAPDAEQAIHRMKLDRSKSTVAHGVVCTTCHMTTEVEATLNAKFSLDTSPTIHGPTGASEAKQAHASAGLGEVVRSELLTQSLMCGSCHNVVNPKGALLENTFSEWYAGPFNTGNPSTDRSCQDCHMPRVEDEIVEGVTKTMHRHTFVGVDLALIEDFPDKERQYRLVEELLQSAAELKLRRVQATRGLALRVDVKNVNNGHALPSGSTADRQVWVHLEVFDQDGRLVFESGMMDANGDLMDRVDDHSLDPGGDPDLLVYGSFLFDEQGDHVTFPWQASRSQDFLLQPGQTGWREFRIEPERLEGVTSIMARATLRYRTFPPFLIRRLKEEGYLAPDAVSDTVPVIDMAMKTLSFSFR